VTAPAFVFVESNTTGTGALFARAAAVRGLRPVLLSADPSRYPFVARGEAEAVQVEVQDRSALLAACRRLCMDGGLAGIWSSSEYFIATAAELARELGLPGPDPEAVSACRDKGVQRTLLAQAGVRGPAFRIVVSVAEAVAAAGSLGLPVVVKPVSGTGSLGVRLCSDMREVEEAAAAILARTVNERGMALPARLLVEEWAAGPEVSVEAFGAEVVGITRKHLGEPPFFVEIGHDFPSPLPPGEELALAETTARCREALSLGWGPLHLELKRSPDRPAVVEVNPRLAGGFIPELVRIATGLDLIAETVAAAAGLEVGLDRRGSRAGAASIRFLLAPGDGKLARVEGMAEAARGEGVVDVQLYHEPGATIARRGDFRDRIGHVIACGATAEESGRAAERARDRVRVVLAAAGA
jgi:biotin carboxylase